MDTDTKQSSPNIEDRTSVISRKVWDIETKETKSIETRLDGKLDRKMITNIKNGENFIAIDNSTNPAKRILLCKLNNKLYNLTTGEEYNA